LSHSRKHFAYLLMNATWIHEEPMLLTGTNFQLSLPFIIHTREVSRIPSVEWMLQSHKFRYEMCRRQDEAYSLFGFCSEDKRVASCWGLKTDCRYCSRPNSAFTSNRSSSDTKAKINLLISAINTCARTSQNLSVCLTVL